MAANIADPVTGVDRKRFLEAQVERKRELQQERQQEQDPASLHSLFNFSYSFDSEKIGDNVSVGVEGIGEYISSITEQILYEKFKDCILEFLKLVDPSDRKGDNITNMLSKRIFLEAIANESDYIFGEFKRALLEDVQSRLRSPDKLSWPPKIWRNEKLNEIIPFDYKEYIKNIISKLQTQSCSPENEAKRTDYAEQIKAARLKKLEKEDPEIELLKIKAILEILKYSVTISTSNKNLFKVLLTQENVFDCMNKLKEMLSKIPDSSKDSNYRKARHLYSVWLQEKGFKYPKQYFRDPRKGGVIGKVSTNMLQRYETT